MADLKPGSHLRTQEFTFDPAYRPLNHGSYGAFPQTVRAKQREIQDRTEARSDPFIRHAIPKLLRESRATVAPLLGAAMEEVVFMPNATTGVNTVLRNLTYVEGDVILYLSTAYGACEKTILHLCETTLAQAVKVDVHFPMEDEVVVSRVRDAVERLARENKQVRIAMFDTVATFPGVQLPWKDLTVLCRELGVVSLIDGAHGVGHIDLTGLGDLSPDFFTSNCHKWLYVPRGCAILYVPFRNQHLIRTTFPTSHGFKPLLENDSASTKDLPSDPLGDLFAWAATIDMSPYLCITEALALRARLGGEDKIREYCFNLARTGSKLMADILGTEVMDNKTQTLSQCCFAMVRLPIQFIPASPSATKTVRSGLLAPEDGPKISKWMMDTLANRHDTWLPVYAYGDALWVRVSAQAYLDLEDFEWVAEVFKGLCQEVVDGWGSAEWLQ